MIDTMMAALLLPLTEASKQVTLQPRMAVINMAAVSPLPKYTKCVARRESHGNPKARNKTSSAAGRYQFLDNAWRDGLSFMVRDRLVKFGTPKKIAEKTRKALVAVNIAKWPAVYQDIGHAAVLDAGGARHWYLKGSVCNKYMKR